MLTRNDVIELLKAVTAGDKRTVGEPDVMLWGAVLREGGVTSLPDAMAAVVRHHATTDAYLKPFHVVQGVSAIRAERLRTAPTDADLMRGFDPDSPAYLPELRRRREAVASGQPVALRAVEQ